MNEYPPAGTGPAGPQGAKGDRGDVGSIGPKGDTGSSGASGAAGRSVTVFQQAGEPGAAIAGDIWIIP